MSMKWRETNRFLAYYGVGYLIFGVLLVGFLRWHKQNSFSREKLETMMTTVSERRDKTDDPCKYSIFGDPTTAQDRFVKIFIYCDPGARATNTLDLRAIKTQTVGGAIKELGRINGFPVTFEEDRIRIGNRSDLKNDQWTCFQDRVEIKDYETKIIPKRTIDCFNGLNLTEVNEVYEKN